MSASRSATGLPSKVAPILIGLAILVTSLPSYNGSSLTNASAFTPGTASLGQLANNSGPIAALQSYSRQGTSTSGMLMDAGAAASATAHVPATLANPLSISRIQSAYRAADAISGTLLVTFTVTNNLSPAITPTVPASTTTGPTGGTAATNDPLGLAHDPHTIHNILLRDTLPQPDAYVDALPAPDRSGGDVVWNLGDVEPLQSVTATLTLHVPAAATDFTTLDSGAGVWGTLEGRAVNAQARPASFAPDTVSDGPTGNWLRSTVDANMTDEYMLDQAGILTQDPLREFAYVQGLGYESYKGSLRGTRGTLWSAAGNSLDKSSLLIAMLRASNIPARYRHGTLSTPLAQQLILSMFPTPTQLVGHIPMGTKLADPANDPKLLSETQDHWWVEAYLPGKGWQDLDPSFSDAAVGQRYVDDSAIATDGTDRSAVVPDTLRHKVTLTVKVETYSANIFSDNQLVESYPLTHTFDAVELVGVPVTLEHLVSTYAPPGLIFSLTQNTYTPYFEVGAQKIYQGQPFDDLISNFPFAQKLITGEWLELDAHDASGNTQHDEYTIKDAIGYAARHAGGTANIAVGSSSGPFTSPDNIVTVLLGPSRMSETAVERATLANDRSELSTSLTYATYRSSDPSSAAGRRAAQSLSNANIAAIRQTEETTAMLFYYGNDAATSVLAGASISRAYADSSRLVLVGSSLDQTSSATPTLTMSMDAVSNRQRTAIGPQQAANVVVGLNLVISTIASAIENTVLSEISPQLAISVSSVFTAATAEGIGFTAIDQTHLAELAQLPLSMEAKARITAAVEQGLVVVTPRAMVSISGTSTVGWYEIDPRTGQATDTMENGQHQGIVEYALIQARNAVIGFAIGCALKGFGLSVISSALNVFGLAGGGVILDVIKNALENISESQSAISDEAVLQLDIATAIEAAVYASSAAAVAGALNSWLVFLIGFGAGFALGDRYCTEPTPVHASNRSSARATTMPRRYQYTPGANLAMQRSTRLHNQPLAPDSSEGLEVTSPHPLADHLIDPSSGNRAPAQPFATQQLHALASGASTAALSLTISNLRLVGATTAGWNVDHSHSVLFQTLSATDASLYTRQGTLPDTGGSASSDGSTASLVQGNLHTALTNSGELSFYSAGLLGLTVGTSWDAYTARLTATTTPFTIAVPSDVVVTATDGAVYDGPLTLSVPDYADLSGSGPTLAPTFAQSVTITADHADIMFGPSTVTSGNLPSDPANGFALVDYSGPLTVTRATTDTDRVELGGSADYFAVHTSPATSATDATTPVTFRAAIDSSADDTYTTTVEVPDGWNVALDNTGLVTATPPLGAEPGDYTILVAVQSGRHPDLFASALHTVTIASRQGLMMSLMPDQRTTVPFGPADPNAAPGDTNNGQLQLTDVAYTVDITNTSTTSHTFNLSESGLPNGWAILSGAGDGTTSTSVTLPPGGFGQVGLYISPTVDMLPPARTQYPFTVRVASPDAPSLDQSASQTFTVPALAFDHLTTDQATVYSSPGLTTTVDLAVRNVGNVAGTFPLSVTEPISTWTAVLTSPLSLDPGQTITQTVTISTPDGTLDQDYPVRIASPTGGYTQTVTINVHLVSPAALKIDQAAQTAARIFPHNTALTAALQQLGQSIETLEAACASATVLAPAGQGDCATDLRDNVVTSAGQVATLATAASPLITAGAAIQQDATALSGDTGVGQSQSASGIQARIVGARQVAIANAATGTVLGDIAALQGDIAALQGQLQEIGAHGLYVVMNPGRRVVLSDKPAIFSLSLTNQGSVTSTYALTFTASAPDLAITPTATTVMVVPGATITVPITATTSTLGSASITATVAVADAPDLAPLHNVLGVTTVDALLRVINVTASPPFVEYGSGAAPTVTARIANVANEPINGTARVRLLDAGGTEVYSAIQPLTISSAIRPIDYALGAIATTSLTTGTYTLAVDVLDAQGQIIPRASGQGLLGVGQAVQASSAVSPTIVAPGDVTVTTCISTGLNLNALGGQSQSEPGGVFVTGHDPDFHAGYQGTIPNNSTGAQHIIQRAIAYTTFNKPNSKILLVTDLRAPGPSYLDSRLGLKAAGFNSFDVADYGSGASGVLNLHTVNFKTYDVVVIASDDGGWLRQDELDILNARSADLLDFVDSGGGIVAFAESGQGNQTTHDRFAFLPFVVSSPPLPETEVNNTTTPVGVALGLTQSDINGNFSHNIFSATGGLDVIDTESNEHPLSLATRGKYITANGVISPTCNRTAAGTISTGIASHVLLPDAAAVESHTHNSTLTAVVKKDSNAPSQQARSIRHLASRPSAHHAALLTHTSIRPRLPMDTSQGQSTKPRSFPVNLHRLPVRVVTRTRIQPAYTTSNDYTATTFVSGLASSGTNGAGPIGLAFDSSGALFVTDPENNYLYKFGRTGGDVSTAVIATAIPGTLTGLTFSKDGQHLYLARQDADDVVEINPSDGTLIRTVASAATQSVLCNPLGLATAPVSGDLFVSEPNCPSGTNIVRISDIESSAPSVSVYSSPGKADGITFGPDGTLYAAIYGSRVVAISGTNTNAPGTVTHIADIPYADGIAVAASNDPNKPPFLLVNRNDGIITKVDLTQNPPILTNIFSGGSRGDFATVGPDGCLYATQTDRVVKVTKADGTCSLVPTNHLSYIATIDHSVPLTHVNVLTDTLAPVPLTTTVDAANTHLLWQQTLNRSAPITTEAFDSLLPNMQPGEVRQVASGTVITYTGGNAPGTLHLGPLFVTAAHLVALSPPTGTVGPGGQAVYTAPLANPTGASLTLTPTVAGLPDGWAAPLAPITLTAGGQVDVPLTITVPTSAVGNGTPDLLGEHPFAVVVADSNGGQDQAGATLTVSDSLGLSVTPGVAAGVDGDVVIYTATITNANAISQSYALSLSGLAPGAATLPVSVTVLAGQAVDVPFTVTVGGPLGPHPFSVTATSPTAGGRADAVLDVLGDRRVAATLSPARAVGGPAVPVLYRLDITNTATLSDTYGFSVSVPDGWSYQVEANGRPVASLSLSPFVLNAANLSLVVTPASDAVPGDVPISVTVESLNDPTVRAVTPATLTVTQRGVQVGLQPKHMTLAPTDSGTWTVAVTNTGSVADTYVLSPTGVIADAARITPSTLSLAPGQTGLAQIATGPITYGLAQTYGLGVLATSQSDPAIRNADTGDVTFTDYHGVQVGLEPAVQTLTDTLRTSYTMLITNTGNLDSSYTFTPHSSAGGPDLTPELNQLEVPAHMTSAILLTAQGHQAGTFSISVRADSTDGTASDTATGSLTINLSPASTRTPGPTPTATPTPTRTPTTASTPSPTPTPSPSAIPTSLPAATPTRTNAPAATPTPTPSATLTGTQIPIPSLTSTSTPTLSSTRIASPMSTGTPSNTPVPAATMARTPLPTPTDTPTSSPTATATPIKAGLPSHPTPTKVVTPALRLDRSSVVVSARLCATGTGFLPGEPVTVAFDGVAVAQPTASGTGGFVTCVATPSTLLQGRNTVSALGARSQTPALASVTGALAHGSAFYLVGASTAGGDATDLAIVNPQRTAASVAIVFYLPSRPSFTRSLVVRARTRATVHLNRYVGAVRGFGLLVRARQDVAAQMIVYRAGRNPYTTLGNGQLSTRWYLAEGYTNLTFHQTLYLLNPGRHPARVLVHLLPANGRREHIVTVVVPGQRTVSLDVNRLYPKQALATIVTSDNPICAERVLTFGRGGFGATGNGGTALAASTWLFAEGATMGGRQTFLTILNPSHRRATVSALLHDERGAIVGVRTIVVDGGHRGTMRLNDTVHATALASTVSSDAPVVVERPYYTNNPNEGRPAATLVYGRGGLGTRWTFPAGDTTHGAHDVLLVFNPNHVSLRLRAAYYLSTGHVVTTSFTVPANARYTVRVNSVAPALANALYGVQLASLDGRGFVAEQTIYDARYATMYGTPGLAQ